MTELYFPYKHIQTETFGKVTIPVAKILLQGKQEETAIDVDVHNKITTKTTKNI